MIKNETATRGRVMIADPIKEQYPANYNIRHPQVRLVETASVDIGVYNTAEALRFAQNSSLDLVLINAATTPPIARICDYEKFIYETKKHNKEKERKNRENAIQLKEIQLKPNISDHDLDIKLNHAREWLSDNCKVKIVIKFRGRELTYKARGFEMINNFVERLGAKIESQPNFNNNNLIAIVSPAVKVSK